MTTDQKLCSKCGERPTMRPDGILCAECAERIEEYNRQHYPSPR